MEIITDRFFEVETAQTKKLRDIVNKALLEEKLIIENLLHPPEEPLSTAQIISDKVAKFGGSWAFIISFFIILVSWILFNVFAPMRDDFDPYPFILMNLVLSCIAALQAPVIMMSQNRKDEKDRKRSENDYLINLKAELEIRALNQKVDLILEEELKILRQNQINQLTLIEKIDQKISPSGIENKS
jgi:uncharacterized membrane protein